MNATLESTYLWAGARAGLIAGLGFGILMGLMGMLPMIAKLYGGSSTIGGLGLHLIISTVIGVIFSVVAGRAAISVQRSIILGLIYGLIWWFLGPLIIMPLWLKMGVQLTAVGLKSALPSLGGHLVYGLILGYLFPIFVHPEKATVSGR